MKLIFKDIDSKFIKTIFVEELDPFHDILRNLKSLKEPFEAHIFAINKKINSQQLVRFKKNIKKLNIHKIYIFSNNRETILAAKSLKIDSTFASEKKLINYLHSENLENQQDLLHKGTIRSGDRICSNGNLFILGDVNPGAIVSAKKNIVVWGKLLGIAFAGEGGNKNASIASLYLNPLQLRINKVVAIGPKDKPKDFHPEIAVLDKKSIVIKPFLLDTSKKFNLND